MVKLASETLTDERFYDRFFALLDRYLPDAPPDDEKPAPEPAKTAPSDKPAAAPELPSRKTG